MKKPPENNDITDVPYLLRAGPLMIAILLIPLAVYLEGSKEPVVDPSGHWRGTLHSADGNTFDLSLLVKGEPSAQGRTEGILTVTVDEKTSHQDTVNVLFQEKQIEIKGDFQLDDSSAKFTFATGDLWTAGTQQPTMFGTFQILVSQKQGRTQLPPRGTWILRRQSDTEDGTTEETPKESSFLRVQ